MSSIPSNRDIYLFLLSVFSKRLAGDQVIKNLIAFVSVIELALNQRGIVIPALSAEFHGLHFSDYTKADSNPFTCASGAQIQIMSNSMCLEWVSESWS